MGEIENPTINEMKVIIEYDNKGIKLDEYYFDTSSIEELCCYMLDEDSFGGLIKDSQSHYTNEYGEDTGIGTDLLYQAKTIVKEIENLKIYNQAKEMIKICKKFNVKELEFMER